MATTAHPTAQRRLVMVKPGHHYVFRCSAGEEPTLIARLGEMIRDTRGGLDWLDAAVISHTLLRKAS